MHAEQSQAEQSQGCAGTHVLTRGIHFTVSASRATNGASEPHSVAKAEDRAASCCLSWAGASANWLGSQVWKMDVILVAVLSTHQEGSLVSLQGRGGSSSIGQSISQKAGTR